MGLDIATDREFRTIDELNALVEAVVKAPLGTQETRWIEWKRTLDLSTLAGRFAVAKAILGFANRSTEVAAQTCEGTAYLVLGAEPGRVDGVQALDHADLVQKIKTFADGPRWTPHDISYSGMTVLVIVVAPPRNGDHIHTLQTDYDKAQAGTIFHRAAAITERAGPNDVLMLEERLLRGIREPDLDVALSMQAEPISRLCVDDSAVQGWLDRREAYARSINQRPLPPTPPSTPTGFADIFGEFGQFSARYATPEDAREFERRVKKDREQCGEQLINNVVRAITRSSKNKVAFAVGNNTQEPIKDVQLTVLLSSPHLLVYAGLSPTRRMPPLPTWPNVLDQMRSPTVADLLTAEDLYHRSYADVVHHDGYTELTYDIGDLRPGKTIPTPPVTVVVWSDTPDRISVELIGRAMNRRGDKKVTTTLTISAQTWSLDQWLKPDGEVPHGP